MEEIQEKKRRGWKRKLGGGLKAAGKVAVALGAGAGLPEVVNAVGAAMGAQQPPVELSSDPLEAALTRLAIAVVAVVMALLKRPQDHLREARD
ncbi:MAG: hypothetical protein GC160_02960 [Acidobacteria bacterium]|nr:hypothetical protein [Acidobacteriota bacterium]